MIDPHFIRRTDPIEPTLFSYIWKHSKRDQILLLCVTVVLFPLLYLTLELPKRIINDAIGAADGIAIVFGWQVPQVTYLMLLCGAFLVAVAVHGLLKMRINTMKGVLAERLLRRFRYLLIGRIFRFPAPYFERTSQGELVSMVTSESEPLGGLMGDAVAQPVLQAGQMLTILGFLFAQSITFGLAACALIPLQAWIIPKLQMQVNLLNKARVQQIRLLATEIGEGAAGAATLRAHGGWRRRLALTSERLGKLYYIRFEIFQKKFFMKFLNNFITQITPFFFYAVGGYLVIKGEITIGALVAALAAYKDLSTPWKELLTYYTQYQDMSLRWGIITEKFAPPGLIDAALFEDTDQAAPRLTGDVVLSGVNVRDSADNAVLDDLTVTFHGASLVAISAPDDEDRRALGALLTRELMPASGSVAIGAYALATLPQSVLAARVGHATSRPVVFSGTFGENILMPLMSAPQIRDVMNEVRLESTRAGNSAEAADANWLNLAAADVAQAGQLSDWWLEVSHAVGFADPLFQRGLDLRLNSGSDAELAQKLVCVRPKVAAALAKARLGSYIWPIEANAYNPAFPVLDNLLFGMPRVPITAEILADQPKFLGLLKDLHLEADLMQLSVSMVEMIHQVFGSEGAAHPLFQRLGLDPAAYSNAIAMTAKHKGGGRLKTREKAQLLVVPFSISAEVIGPSFPHEIKDKVLKMRQAHGPALQAQMRDVFVPLQEDQPAANLSVLENVIFGRLSQAAGRNGDDIRSVVGDVLRSEGLDGAVLSLIFDMPVSGGSATLPAQIAEPLALSRAALKRPDLLILDTVMAGYTPAARTQMYHNLHRLLPETTIICLEPEFAQTVDFDMHLTLHKGRVVTQSDATPALTGRAISDDQARKMQILEKADLFSGLDRKQIRLLAFGAQWHTAQAGEYLFYKDDDPSSGAYLIMEGEAELLLPQADAADLLVLTAGAGTLVGELGLIRNEPRALDMRAKTDLTSLRIGAEEFLAVVEHDAATAYKLLQVVAGYAGKQGK